VKFTLDSNVLVDAIRSPESFAEYETFIKWARRHTWLSAVVVAELHAGARGPKARRALDERFFAPLELRGRLVAPSVADWRRAGAVLGDRRSDPPAAARLNDALLAVQARANGWIVITRDADFRRLQRLIPGLLLAAPYPGA
jgi:predicted nucleic acid-binding protein